MFPESNPLRQFFNELVERNYAEVGIRSLEVQSYVVNLLTEFCETEELYKVRNEDGRALQDVGYIPGVDTSTSHDVNSPSRRFHQFGDRIRPLQAVRLASRGEKAIGARLGDVVERVLQISGHIERAMKSSGHRPRQLTQLSRARGIDAP